MSWKNARRDQDKKTRKMIAAPSWQRAPEQFNTNECVSYANRVIDFFLAFNYNSIWMVHNFMFHRWIALFCLSISQMVSFQKRRERKKATEFRILVTLCALQSNTIGPKKHRNANQFKYRMKSHSIDICGKESSDFFFKCNIFFLKWIHGRNLETACSSNGISIQKFSWVELSNLI